MATFMKFGTCSPVCVKEQEALEAIDDRDRATYDAWKKINTTARTTLPSTLDDDILMEFKDHQRAMYLWSALKNRFGTYSSP
ncbi:hypothetical protein KY285_010729 [Solanum tuberosum]|nr:hypothetical protein KY284_010585 [Solanum tuberosum]KAH0735022.1 hypothetical protein KY285_010729 [Solanum tuberosum]